MVVSNTYPDAGGDVTERVYTHKNLRQLRKCIELLK